MSYVLILVTGTFYSALLTCTDIGVVFVFYIFYRDFLSNVSFQGECSGNYIVTFCASEQTHCALVIYDCMSDCSFTQCIFECPPKWCTSALFGCYMAGAT